MEQSQQNLEELMAGVELMISDHYKAYAAQFPEHEEFWNKISAEEIDHAGWIRDLCSKSREGLVLLNDARFDKSSLIEFTKKLPDMLFSMRRQATSMKEALKNSLGLESLLLEKKFFEVFTTDAPELKAVLGRLAESTREHRERLAQFLKKL